jgi:hypothetical protein
MPKPLDNYWMDRRGYQFITSPLKCIRKSCFRTKRDNNDTCWRKECFSGNDTPLTTIQKCPSFCSDDTFQCSEGSRGPLCGSCVAGYTFSTTDQTCTKCFGDSLVKAPSFWFFIFLTLFLSSGFMFYYYYSEVVQGEPKDWVVNVQHIIRVVMHYAENGVLRVMVCRFLIFLLVS